MFKLNVRKSEYGWSTRIKNIQNDEEISMYMNIQFAKCDAPTDEALQINVKDCFMSCYKTNNEEVKPKLVIMEYEVIKVYNNDNQSETQSQDPIIDLDIPVEISDEDIPF